MQMKATGVIVEFNPLHNGHIEHLRETKKITGCEKIIAAMSGNFVQRGEPAIYDKWQRTKDALEAGVDIVVEIPVPFVLSGADYFARAGVEILAATGVVDAISFGSESGNLAAIQEAAHILANEPPTYKNALHIALQKGLNFAAARATALQTCLPQIPPDLLTKPNNCLAMEYCKALHLIGNPLKIFTTHRKPGGPSATKLRQEIFSTLNSQLSTPNSLPRLDDFSQIFRYLMHTQDFTLGEGVENRFRKLAGQYATITDFLDAAKTKRYTRTRLQRAVMRIILGITPPTGSPEYIRVLGFRRESADLLGAITKNANLPVITHGAALDAALATSKMLAKELEAGDIYRTATKTPGGYRAERGIQMVVM